MSPRPSKAEVSDLMAMGSNLDETKASMVMARVDMELERQRREAKTVMAKEKLEQEVGSSIKKYKASTDFTIDMA